MDSGNSCDKKVDKVIRWIRMLSLDKDRSRACSFGKFQLSLIMVLVLILMEHALPD